MQSSWVAPHNMGDSSIRMLARWGAQDLHISVVTARAFWEYRSGNVHHTDGFIRCWGVFLRREVMNSGERSRLQGINKDERWASQVGCKEWQITQGHGVQSVGRPSILPMGYFQRTQSLHNGTQSTKPSGGRATNTQPHASV